MFQYILLIFFRFYNEYIILLFLYTLFIFVMYHHLADFVGLADEFVAIFMVSYFK